MSPKRSSGQGHGRGNRSHQGRHRPDKDFRCSGAETRFLEKTDLENRAEAVIMRERGRNSVVECQLPKLDVRGSNPLARFRLTADLEFGHQLSGGRFEVSTKALGRKAGLHLISDPADTILRG